MSRYLPHNHAITEPIGSRQIERWAEFRALGLVYPGHLVPPRTALTSADRTQAASAQFHSTWTQIWRRG